MAQHAAEPAPVDPPVDDPGKRAERQAADIEQSFAEDGGPEDVERGRIARSPREIPRTGWRDILLRTKQEVADDNVSLVAAGVAFYGLLAVFPGIAALVSLYGLLADPTSA